MRVIQKENLIDGTNVTGETTSDAIDMRQYTGYAIQAIWDVNTPSAKAFTAAATDICTTATHGYTTGLKGQASTTTTLPAGLAAATDYYVIVLTANTFKLASSLENALAGTAVDITDAGTGTHTFTPTALAGGAIKLQKKPTENATWTDVTSSSQNITADGSYMWEAGDFYSGYLRVHSTLTAGRYQLNVHVSAKGESV
jgi:hypothetical protein